MSKHNSASAPNWIRYTLCLPVGLSFPALIIATFQGVDIPYPVVVIAGYCSLRALAYVHHDRQHNLAELLRSLLDAYGRKR